MSASRAMDQADFDLERFINMFDEALTSNDPRVIDALRSLMMMVILTKPDTTNSPPMDKTAGPLRSLHNDMTTLSRRLSRLEEELRTHTKESHREAMQRQWGSRTIDQWKDEALKYRYSDEYNLKEDEIIKQFLNPKVKNLK